MQLQLPSDCGKSSNGLEVFLVLFVGTFLRGY